MLVQGIKEPGWQKPKTFTSTEQQAIFSNAQSDPDLELAEIVFAIMRNTGLHNSELRHAQHRNLDLNSSPPTFHVTGDASEYDIVPRVIPLNEHCSGTTRSLDLHTEQLCLWARI
jgi:hypothetical protein